LEVEINKLKTEEATLRDALLKMQNLNEGLGQDKIELNKIIMQVCKELGGTIFYNHNMEY
jgi:rootletin